MVQLSATMEQTRETQLAQLYDVLGFQRAIARYDVLSTRHETGPRPRSMSTCRDHCGTGRVHRSRPRSLRPRSRKAEITVKPPERGVSKSPSFRERDVNRKHVYRVMLYLALTWRCVAPQWDIVPK